MDAFTQRIEASKRGYFSIDHNVPRGILKAANAAHAARVAAAYVAMQIDQRELYRHLESQVAGELAGSGVWPKSTGRYANLVAQVDRAVVATADEAAASKAGLLAEAFTGSGSGLDLLG